MTKIRSLLALLFALTLALSVLPASVSAALNPLPAPVQKIYDRTDKGVLEGRPGSSWVWGPRVQDSTEPYKESPNGNRQVFYFEKGRLEITNPAGNPNDKYFVTSGLLLREMITGKVQTGDATLEDRGPANVVLAGDFAPGVQDSPTYASLADLVSFDGVWKSSDLTGQPVTKVLGLGGAVSTNTGLAQGVVYAQYYKETGHNVAKPFIDFMNKKGTVYENGKYVNNQPLFDPLYVFGYPIAEPYWAHVTVAGKEQFVLVQAFERRLLTYTPTNPDPYKVELGNLGLAYVQWRYKSAPTVFNNTDPDYNRPTASDGFNLLNATNGNMQKLNAVKRTVTSGKQVLYNEQYQAPNKARQLQAVTYQGQPGTLETIIIGSRVFLRLIAPKSSGKWFYQDTPTAFTWPAGFRDFRTYSLNDWNLDWQATPPANSGSDVIRSLITNYVDIDGSKVTRNRLVSAKNNLALAMTTDTVLPDNTKVSQTFNYSDFNVPNNIVAPSGASPLTFSADVSQFQDQPKGVLVKFKDSYQTESAGFTQNYSALSLAQGWGNLSSDMPVLFKLNGADLDSTLASLRSDARVEYAEPDYVRHSFITQVNDPSSGDQYYLKAIHAPRAWDFGTGSKAVTVAVIDSGADLNNPDLKGNIAETYNSELNNNDVSDAEGHGSWTSGIIGALGNNSVYGSGLAWNSKIMVVRADTDDNPGSFTDSSLVKALHYATDHGARIINMSLGGTEDTKALRDAVAYATDRGVLIIASSGNGGDNVPNYPASYPHVISVGATGWLGQPASFSSYNNKVILSAPGVHICNTVRAAQFACLDGTSASAPVVTGVATLVMSINPNLSADQVKAILIASATPVPGKQPGERDDKYGYGIVDAGVAARMAAANQFPGLPGNIPQ